MVNIHNNQIYAIGCIIFFTKMILFIWFSILYDSVGFFCGPYLNYVLGKQLEIIIF